jgi:hypothetical protein
MAGIECTPDDRGDLFPSTPTDRTGHQGTGASRKRLERQRRTWRTRDFASRGADTVGGENRAGQKVAQVPGRSREKALLTATGRLI